MSTILNALKRLEDQRRAGDAQQVPASMAGRGTATRGKSRLRLVVALVGVIILAGTPLFWIYRHWSAGEGRALDAAPPVPQAQTPSPASPRTAPLTVPPRERQRAEAVRMARRNRDRLPLNTAAGAPSNSPIALNAPGYVPPDPEGQSARVRSPEHYPDGQTRDLSPSSPATPRPADQDPFALTEVLPKDALQLQAISWSDRPGDRITIITGRIMREGQSIDGYTVIEIRSEDVIVEKEGKHWRLVYDSP